MNTFKRKSLYAAVVTGLAAMGFAGTASAVYVNTDGTGQVLIYPYFSVRTAGTPLATGAYNTYISVTNTTASAKAVKVRFMEGKGSKEVLDFNLFLSPHDVWTGAVVPNSDTDSTLGAKIITADKSCTTPKIGASGQSFLTGAYLGDLAGDTIDRTSEGYVELLEMGVITNTTLLGTITHNNGVATCDDAILTTADSANLVGYLTSATGGLFGGSSLINPATGVDYTYEAVALDNWDATVGGNPSASSSALPTIASGSVTTSEVFTGTQVHVATFAGVNAGRDAVSASMMRNHVLNEFVLDSGSASTTDWVVTFPTKRYYVAGATALSRQPFTNPFIATGSCDTVSLSWWNREEQSPGGSGSAFSPATPGVLPQLCWEANVITFNANPATKSAVLGSTNVKNVAVTGTFPNGWMNLGFNQPNNVLVAVASTTNGVADATPSTYTGLPVVGFMVQDFVNTNLVTGTATTATPGAAFGGNFGHKYTRLITP